MLRNKIICLVGICGAGMAPLAIYLSKQGAVVYGWDDFPDLCIKDLLIRERIIFLPNKILPTNCEVVVISSAIQVDSDEICIAAKAAGILIRRRGEYLAEVLSDRKLIAIIGSHGKTSVCANIAELVIQSAMHVDYIVGGFFKDGKYLPAQYYADSEWVVAEIDESDGTIASFDPQLTVALNYDDDHIVNYHGTEGLKATFSQFFSKTKEEIFLPKDDKILPLLIQETRADIFYFENLPGKNFVHRNCEIAKIVFQKIFKKNVQNFENFTGINRRYDLMYHTDKIIFMHDYAHHPTEMQALLEYVRFRYPNHHITAIFQPHRITRTKQYYKEFAKVLQDFDNIILVDIYRAFEERLSEVSSSLIFDKIDNSNKLLVDDLNKLENILQMYCKNLNPDTQHLILFICAGDLIKYAKHFVNEWSIKSVQDELKDIEHSENVSLKNNTTFGCQSIARLLIKPSDILQLKSVLTSCLRYNKSYFLLGNGSNLVFPDGVFYDVLIKLSNNFWNQCIVLKPGIVRVFAGTKLSQFVQFSQRLGFNCCSFLSGIPATIGGAITMNAGAYGSSISDIVTGVTVMDNEGNIIQLKTNECGFRYRGSNISGIILYADVKLKNIELLDRQDFFTLRRNTQPIGRTFGSIFKNPDKDYAGRLIDLVSLKGVRHGDAMISDKHANFMLNIENARAEDVEYLVDLARYEVFNKFNIFLENEFLFLRK